MLMQSKDVGNQYLLTNEIHGMEVVNGFTLEGLFFLPFYLKKRDIQVTKRGL